MESLWSSSLNKSDYAWFWHSRDYLNFLQELNRNYSYEDLSFFVMNEERVVAVCPLFVSLDKDKSPGFSCGDVGIEFPAIINDVSETEKNKILHIYLSEVKDCAISRNINKIKLRISPMSKKHIFATRIYSSGLAKLGFKEYSKNTQIIDLDKDYSELWKDVRKGHKSAIRKSEKSGVSFKVLSSAQVTEEIIYEYAKVDTINKINTNKNIACFDIIYNWIRNDNAVLLRSEFEGNAIAFVLMVIKAGTAYYGASCQLPNYSYLNPVHFLVWNSFKFLKEEHICYLDMGEQVFGAQFGYTPTEKELQIAKFKRGFGGYTVPIYSGIWDIY